MTMRPFKSTIGFDEALARVLAAVAPIDSTEQVHIAAADGRVLAEDAASPTDVPGFDRAAMDGYAVRTADLATARPDAMSTLTVVDTIYTGHLPVVAVAQGECAQIATGAMVPPGADAVVMVEETTRTGERVTFRKPTALGQNIGRRAADIGAGQVVARDGDYLTPARIGALAAIGRVYLRVYTRPHVAVVTTGDEVVNPTVIQARGESTMPTQSLPIPPGKVFNVNGITLHAMVKKHGGRATSISEVPDDLAQLLDRINRTSMHDLWVFSGGSSVGEKDLVIDAMRAFGEIVFHGVAVKPGKPTALGTVRRAPALALPGNPTSCLSNAYLFLVPMLRKLARLPPWRPEQRVATLATRVKSERGRVQFYMVRLEAAQAVPVFKSSGDITSLAGADGYFTIGADVESVEAGAEVTVTMF